MSNRYYIIKKPVIEGVPTNFKKIALKNVSKEKSIKRFLDCKPWREGNYFFGRIDLQDYNGRFEKSIYFYINEMYMKDCDIHKILHFGYGLPFTLSKITVEEYENRPDEFKEYDSTHIEKAIVNAYSDRQYKNDF